MLLLIPMRFLFIVGIVLLLFSGCQSEQKEVHDTEPSDSASQSEKAESPAALFIEEIREAHHASAFFSHEAIAFDLNLSFGGKARLNGTVTMLTNSTKVLLERDDGAAVLYDGTDVYISPSGADWPRARFDVLTWMYFFAAPYKLDDPGTEMEMLGRLPLEGDSSQAGRLTFGSEIGDAPDDWYIVYKDDSTNLIRAMAYIVTYGKTEEESAKAEPHAIVYSDYREVEGFPFAHRWTFTNWSREEGVSGERGAAEISNIRFVEQPRFSLQGEKKAIPLSQ